MGGDEVLHAWNWSFVPLDVLAISAGLTWSLLPQQHRLSTPLFATALALTHAAGLMAVSFFALWGSWDASWWLVNLWLVLMPIALAAISLARRSNSSLNEPALEGADHQLGAVPSAGFAEERAHVGLDGLRGDEQLGSDLRVREPAAHE